MQIRIAFLLVLSLLIAGCSSSVASPDPVIEATPEQTAFIEPTAISETASPSPSETPEHTPTISPTDTPPPTETGIALMEDFEVRVHPEGGLFVGDLVSFEVISPEEAVGNLEVALNVAGEEELARERFGYFGIGDRRQATLRWVWDTTGLGAGDYDLEFTVFPYEEVITRTYTLLPASLLKYPEPEASWAVAESDCCLVYYVTGSAAERDLELLLDIADREAISTSEQLQTDFIEPVTIVFLPRVLGHGGFAGREIYISYLDRNYAGNGPAQVIHHEMVHILDSRIGGNLRPSMFVEGLAVYLSGGHFKREPILARAAAALDLGMYIPLEELTKDFYLAQHEVSYLQGAALIEFMIRTWGWDAYSNFYRSITAVEGGEKIDAIDQALFANFGITFEDLESAFIEFLDAQPYDAGDAADIQSSVDFFDTVRRYQLALDPSAYFLTAWLVGIGDMVNSGVVADYVRHPALPENIALEAMLVAADIKIREADYASADLLLDAINLALDFYESNPQIAFISTPIVADYMLLTNVALEAGFDPQQIILMPNEGVVLGTKDSYDLVELVWLRGDSGWDFAD